MEDQSWYSGAANVLPAAVSDEAGAIEEAPPLEGELDDVDDVVDFEQAAATIPMIAAETTNSFERLFTPFLLLLLGPPWQGEAVRLACSRSSYRDRRGAIPSIGDLLANSE